MAANLTIFCADLIEVYQVVHSASVHSTYDHPANEVGNGKQVYEFDAVFTKLSFSDFPIQAFNPRSKILVSVFW